MEDKARQLKEQKGNVSEQEQKPAGNPMFPKNFVGALADEVAKTLINRLPHILPRRKKRKTTNNSMKKIEKAFFLDTSAIIDGRIFDVFSLGFYSGPIVILENILLELKHIADSQDSVKRERGRKGLEFLSRLKKTKGIKVITISENDIKNYPKNKIKEVDESLITVTKIAKGKVITCDYNLEKKAHIQGVLAINVNALANTLKVRAVPGEALHVNISHKGKDATQGVGYLDDGTMIVVENASVYIAKDLDVVVSRVIQTATGRILFAKKI